MTPVDPRQVRRNFTRAAAGYDAAAEVQREVARRMLERLDDVRIEPSGVLDLGCGTGAHLTALSERYPKARLVGVDFCEAMLRAGRPPRSRLRWLLPFVRGHAAPLLAADACALPLASGAIGMVWSNLMLQWLNDPLAALRESLRVLEVGGLLMFSTLGPDTLQELRAAFDDGAPHTLSFIDMHDYGDMLVDCGFADPVVDVERLTLTYAQFDDLVRDLRRNGAACAHAERRRGLMGRQAWQAAHARYRRFMREDRLPASFEIIYGHAWKAAPKKTADGRDIVRIERPVRKA